MSKFACALFLYLILLGFPFSAFAANFYVATDGNDSNPGTVTQPWKTIQKAAETLEGGDTVFVREGTYTGDVHPANHGREGAWITFKNYPGEKPVLDGFAGSQGDWDAFYLGKWGGTLTDEGSYIEVNGFKIRNYNGAGIGCRNSHHIKILNNVIEYNGGGSIQSAEAGCDYLTVENNILRYSGILSDGTPGKCWCSNLGLNQKLGRDYIHDGKFHDIYRDNIIYGGVDNSDDHTEGSGIIIDLGGDVPPRLIENNLIFNNGRSCVNVYNSHNVWLIGNTCFKNCQDFGDCPDGWTAELALETSNSNKVVSRGNIIFADKAYSFSGSQNTSQSDYNLFFGGRELLGERGPHDITGQNPKLSNINIDCSPNTYANPQSICKSDNPDDFRAYFGLTNQSPAIDKIPESSASYQGPGQTEHILAVDRDGISRPQGASYDIGAYEYINVTQLTPTPTPSCKPGDVNCNGSVDAFDLNLILSSWLGTGSCSGFNCNLNSDNKVNALDAVIVLANFGQ